MTSRTDKPADGRKSKRLEKRADALRENLMKRKQQSRARAQQEKK
jgi:hypothetical protein